MPLADRLVYFSVDGLVALRALGAGLDDVRAALAARR